MKITLLFFASLRDMLNAPQVELEMPEGTIQDAVDLLATRYPQARRLLERVHAAVNEEYRERNTPLRDGDILALIPPVSGGAR